MRNETITISRLVWIRTLSDWYLAIIQRDGRAQSLFRMNQVCFEGLADHKLIRLSVRED